MFYYAQRCNKNLAVHQFCHRVEPSTAFVSLLFSFKSHFLFYNIQWREVKSLKAVRLSQIEGWPKWDLSNSNFPPFCLFWIAMSQCKHWKICCWPIRICFDLKSGGKFKKDKWFLCHPSIWLNLSALVKRLNKRG